MSQQRPQLKVNWLGMPVVGVMWGRLLVQAVGLGALYMYETDGDSHEHLNKSYYVGELIGLSRGTFWTGMWLEAYCDVSLRNSFDSPVMSEALVSFRVFLKCHDIISVGEEV